MWEFMKKNLLSNPDSMIFDGVRSSTYREYYDEIVNKGEILKKNFIANSKICIACEHSYNTSLAILVCWYAEMVPIPISTHYGLEMYKNTVKFIKPAMIITDGNKIPDSGIISKDIMSFYFEESMKNNQNCIITDAAMILCTSGTTGTPKGILLSAESLIKNVLNVSRFLQIGCEDSYFIARPLCHSAVITIEFLLSFYYGANLCFGSGKYNPQKIIEFMNKYNITVMSGTPTLIYHLAKYCELLHQDVNIQTLSLSGECLTSVQAKTIRRVFKDAQIHMQYGLTETGPMLTHLPYECFDEYFQSVGIPLNNVVIKVVDSFENKKELKKNESGLIIAKTESMMNGYYKDENQTEQTINDGWINTKDIGYIAENGMIYINSRADDMIIIGGLNIYPKEIENYILQLPEIEEVLLYTKKEFDEPYIIVDIVLAEPYQLLSKKQLSKLLSSILPPYMMAKKVNIVSELSKNASGKLVRKR